MKNAKIHAALNDDEAFRNHLATVAENGNRIWLFPRQTTGWFTLKRSQVAILLIGLWIVGPWLTYNGQPLMMFNVIDRHFILFGSHFYPQDLPYVAILLLSFFVGVALFTMSFGRVWCGWACPQTLFMEQLFRRVEYWIEGNARQQYLLDQQNWNWEKVWKRSLKHTIYLVFAIWSSLVVQLYVFGKNSTWQWLHDGLLSNTGRLTFLGFFALAFYLVFSWAREQVCIAMCPYGRLQGVLLNNNSLTVIYNWLRGEPRKNKVGSEAMAQPGDCIDCKLCLHVCPTGIDIRNGSQLECINCTACIDACDGVMDKIGKPKGLITLSSYADITNQKAGWRPTKRIWFAIAAMTLILIADVVLLASRSTFSATILRVPGQLYQLKADGTLTNLYNLQISNKTTVTTTYQLLSEQGATIELIGKQQLVLAPNQQVDVNIFVSLNKSALQPGKNVITFRLISVKSGDQKLLKTTFFTPLEP